MKVIRMKAYQRDGIRIVCVSFSEADIEELWEVVKDCNKKRIIQSVSFARERLKKYCKKLDAKRKPT